MEFDKTKLHNKFIEKVSQDIIFYKQPFFPSEVKYIFDCIDLVRKLEKTWEQISVDLDAPEDCVKFCIEFAHHMRDKDD